MSASDLPYLYENVNRKIAYPYSDFNPKAYTEASYARSSIASQPRPKQEGPLINFNQHPDSYVVVGGTQEAHKPLPAATKKAVVSVRWVQFGLRLVQEVVALGLLVATICIKSTSGAETYLLRIPQAWDSLIGIYAIYHLLRPAKGRMAGSSASYHMFALIMDVALVPLYVYITLLVNNNRQLPVEEKNSSGRVLDGNWRWTSFFASQADTNLLLLCTFIGAVILAGLHLLSCGIDVYLVIVFRKISALPPDMNPLEDNLTSRPRGSKHQHKNSELTLSSNNRSTSELSDAEKKRLAHLSGSTFSVGNASRTSVAKDSLLDGQERVMPFGDSRTGSKTNLAFSPHNPETARWSRHEYDGQQVVYQEAVRNPRRSRYEVRADGKLEVRTRGGSHSPSKRSSQNVSATDFAASGDPAKRSSFVDTFELPPMASPDRAENASPRPASYMTARTSSPAVPNAAPNYSHVRGEQKEALLNDNWYVLEDDVSDMGSPSRQHTPAPPSKSSAKNGYMGVPTHDRHDSFEPVGRQETRALKPLGMHPPTPPMPDAEDYDHSGDTGVGRTLTAASNATASSSLYSDSAPSLQTSQANQGASTPKGRYYGNLAAAQRGVRGGYGLPPSPQISRSPSPEKQSRVISRSGADIADEAVLYVPESKFSMRSRRDVSGKVAEEGRGSWGKR
ncbi:hypothetical protein LTR36_004182 [Oleoguttula mirabilis]|uniref:Uncharacterized protein n=1 Tax=Oleoguttula mirabilis TaxID=1507867 RepID=A0AAV9JHZ3_9PEZI|nr:hypothetical protein LTR36_004182 [Oleoguttula mirabilis]